MNFIVLITLFSVLFIPDSYATVAKDTLSLATRATTTLAPFKRIANLCPTSSPIPEAIDGAAWLNITSVCGRMDQLHSTFIYSDYKCIRCKLGQMYNIRSKNGNSCKSEQSNILDSYIAIDTISKEYIVAFRGKTTLNFVRDDPHTRFSKISIPGVTIPADVAVHQGFWLRLVKMGYNKLLDLVAKTPPSNSYFRLHETLLRFFTAELAKNRDYSIVTTGHSLGGALSSIAGAILKEKFKVPVKIYTFGQPRTGNKPYVDWVEKSVDRENIFRSVSMNDPIPQFPTQKQGYMHHGVEYWTCEDGDTETDTRKCDLPEQPNCSRSITTTDPKIDRGPHLHYFGVPEAIEFCERRPK
ncbi:Alpha/Beta hydrolase protein [Collybia nuda]|uniref:Alpha/Beta hydrolase protein n=1 Tax=Collybia nuda TaxID=64659 RepID=A0A9P6CGT3_9AGAR|nr:Alpha/Beta hydrolase protein [Collybia nuda]